MDVNPGKVVLEAGKGAVTGAVAGTGAGLLVVAGTSGVVEIWRRLIRSESPSKKKKIWIIHML